MMAGSQDTFVDVASIESNPLKPSVSKESLEWDLKAMGSHTAWAEKLGQSRGHSLCSSVTVARILSEGVQTWNWEAAGMAPYSYAEQFYPGVTAEMWWIINMCDKQDELVLYDMLASRDGGFHTCVWEVTMIREAAGELLKEICYQFQQVEQAEFVSKSRLLQADGQ